MLAGLVVELGGIGMGAVLEAAPSAMQLAAVPVEAAGLAPHWRRKSSFAVCENVLQNSDAALLAPLCPVELVALAAAGGRAVVLAEAAALAERLVARGRRASEAVLAGTTEGLVYRKSPFAV